MGTRIPPSLSFGQPQRTCPMSLGSEAFSLEAAGKMRFPPSWVEAWRDGELPGKKGRGGTCHTGLFFPLVSSCSSRPKLLLLLRTSWGAGGGRDRAAAC